MQLSAIPMPPAFVLVERVLRVYTTEGAALDIQLLNFDAARFDIDAYAASGIICPPAIARSVRKRQAEFLCGRLAARLAMSGLAGAYTHCEIVIGPAQEPIWPNGLIGSISHCTDMAAAIALPAAHGRHGIGIDIEHVVKGETLRAVLDIAVSAHEGRVLDRMPPRYTPELLTTILFSAKESFYKSAYATVARFFDFSALCLEALDVDAGRVWLILTDTLSETLVCGQRVEVGFDLLGPDTVLTHHLW